MENFIRRIEKIENYLKSRRPSHTVIHYVDEESREDAIKKYITLNKLNVRSGPLRIVEVKFV